MSPYLFEGRIMLRTAIRQFLLWLVLVTCLKPITTSAQEIGIFGDQAGNWCMITAELGGAPVMAFILALDVQSGITGAEFSIAGLPTNLYIAIPQANPASNIALGDPFTTGANIAFPNCQTDAIVLLYSVILINTGDDAGDRTLVVQSRMPPTNPNFDCPLITKCDGPTFTSVCVFGR